MISRVITQMQSKLKLKDFRSNLYFSLLVSFHAFDKQQFGGEVLKRDNPQEEWQNLHERGYLL